MKQKIRLYIRDDEDNPGVITFDADVDMPTMHTIDGVLTAYMLTGLSFTPGEGYSQPADKVVEFCRALNKNKEALILKHIRNDATYSDGYKDAIKTATELAKSMLGVSDI